MLGEVRGHQDFDGIDFKDTAFQLRARGTVRKTVQKHVAGAGLNCLQTQTHAVNQMMSKMCSYSSKLTVIHCIN